MTYLRTPRKACTCGAYPFPHRDNDKNCIDFRRIERDKKASSRFAYPYKEALFESGHKEKDFI